MDITEIMITDLENIYKRYNSSGFTFLDEFEIPYSELTTLILMFDFFTYDKVESVNYFVYEYKQIKSDKIPNLKIQLLQFIDFYVDNIHNPNFSDFREIAAKTYLFNYKNKYSENHKFPILPKNEIPNSIYIDLVTGFDFINFYEQLDKNIDYHLVDKSVFSCKCLELKAKELNLTNVFVISKDVLELEKVDFNKPIGLIRAKNIFKYVPLFLIDFI